MERLRTLKNRKTHNKNAKNRRNTIGVNNTVKFMKSKPVVLRTSYRKATAFQVELEDIPIYFINAHSCICTMKETCMGEEFERYFEIPADTYLLTHGEPGDYSCLTERSIDYLIQNSEDIRGFLTVHSSSNLRRMNENKKYSFFDQMMRAAQNRERGDKIQYPNINYSFNPDEERTPRRLNKYGVYRIDDPSGKLNYFTLNNTLSLIPQDPKRKNWFLSDVIREVYERTGIPKGIFVNGGCLSSCSKLTPTGEHIDKAASLVSLANALFPTFRETLTQEEMEQRNMYVPANEGTNLRFFKIHPEVAKELVESGLYKAEDLLKEKNIWANTNDIKQFREYIERKKKEKKRK